MYEHVNEPVSVAAVFGTGQRRVRPFKLRWQGRDYEITHVDYQYKYKRGEATIHVFSVTDGTNYFELQYDSADLTWRLGRVSDGEAN